ncbi:hypothetical protein JQ634_07345, partial [Bradyrhizobium sp. AUGA SZCCT0240]
MLQSNAILASLSAGDASALAPHLDGIAPMPWLKSAANWTPGTEEVQPEEIRVTFMGSSPLPRPGQMG